MWTAQDEGGCEGMLWGEGEAGLEGAGRGGMGLWGGYPNPGPCPRVVMAEAEEVGAAVELSPLPPNIPDELLMLYFETHRRSGGGPVLSWQRLGHGGVLTFQEPAGEVADGKGSLGPSWATGTDTPLHPTPAHRRSKGLGPEGACIVRCSAEPVASPAARPCSPPAPRTAPWYCTPVPGAACPGPAACHGAPGAALPCLGQSPTRQGPDPAAQAPL